MRFSAVAMFGTALSVLGAPGFAQELCGTLGTGAQWIGGDEASSDISTAPSFFDQFAVTVPEGGNALTAFTVSIPGSYRVEAQPVPGGDTVIELYSSDGQIVISDDDSGGGLASRAETFLNPGTYCLLTRAFAYSSVVADIRVAREEHETLTAGWDNGTGTFAGVEACLPTTNATFLGRGPVDGQLQAGVEQTNSANAVAYYRFTLGTPQAITITAENEWADPYIYLFDGNGGLLAENDDHRGLDSQIDVTEALPAGDYCIGMRALSDPNEPITLTLRQYDPARELLDLYADGRVSPPPNSGYPVTELGTLNSRLVYDQNVGSDAVWYSFSVPAGGLVLIDAVEISNSDPMISLFDGSGRELAFNDDAGGTFDSQIATPVGPGHYMLAVMQYSGGYNGVIRVNIQRYVPAQ